MIFSLKKCEIVDYGAVLTDRVREWDLQGGNVLEDNVYKYLGFLFHQPLSGKVHAVNLNGRVRRRIGQLRHVVHNEGLQLPTVRKVVLACVASVIEYGSLPPSGEDTRCPVCKHANEDLVHLLTCPGLDRPPDWPKTILH